jgi:hypothetical protein
MGASLTCTCDLNVNNNPSVAGAIVAVPSNASTATSGEQRAKALIHAKCKQSVATAVTTPPVSVGAFEPQASLRYQMQAWAAPWLAPRPSGVGLPNTEHGCQSTRCRTFSPALLTWGFGVWQYASGVHAAFAWSTLKHAHRSIAETEVQHRRHRKVDHS